MPIYEYQCQSCGKTFEILVRTSERENVKCKHCGGSQLEKLISVPNMLKGTATMVNPMPCGKEGSCDTSQCSTPQCSSGCGCTRSS